MHVQTTVTVSNPPPHSDVVSAFPSRIADAWLDVQALEVNYGDIEAIRGISFTIGKGEVVALLGPNGAGKSTIINTISGLLTPARGTILLDGNDITHLSPKEKFRAGIALSPEGRKVFGQMSVLENLLIGAHLRNNKKEAAGDLEFVYSMFPKLKTRTRQLSGTLSGGEQQMLAIGRALMGRPQLLLLDEPSLGMAPIIIDQVIDVVRSLRFRGVSTLLVEQNAGAALSLADRAYILSLGRLSAHGTPAELDRSGALSSVYFGG